MHFKGSLPNLCIQSYAIHVHACNTCNAIHVHTFFPTSAIASVLCTCISMHISIMLHYVCACTCTYMTYTCTCTLYMHMYTCSLIFSCYMYVPPSSVSLRSVFSHIHQSSSRTDPAHSGNNIHVLYRCNYSTVPSSLTEVLHVLYSTLLDCHHTHIHEYVRTWHMYMNMYLQVIL